MRIITPAPLSGALRIMPSKSASHRALLVAALAAGESMVSPLQLSEDVQATLRGIAGLGLAKMASLEEIPGQPGFVRACLTGGLSPSVDQFRLVDCGESGSTLRFLLPLALDGRGVVRFTGQGRLLQRPLAPYQKIFAKQGLAWTQDEESLTLNGLLKPGSFTLPGDVSSQFVTGLLLALPRLPGNSVITLTSPLESRGYVDLTLAALAGAGVRCAWEGEQTLRVPGHQAAQPGAFAVEGDWSHAAFYLVAGLLGGEVRLTGLNSASQQGDKAIVDILRGLGGDITEADGVWIARPSALHGGRIDASQVPDLVPALVTAACAARGEVVIHGAARLRLKESDRLAALRQEFSSLGANIAETTDGLIIHGGMPLSGGEVDSHRDHRIAMALAVAAPLCKSPFKLSGDDSVAKSAPAFWAEYQSLVRCNA